MLRRVTIHPGIETFARGPFDDGLKEHTLERHRRGVSWFKSIVPVAERSCAGGRTTITADVNIEIPLTSKSPSILPFSHIAFRRQIPAGSGRVGKCEA